MLLTGGNGAFKCAENAHALKSQRGTRRRFRYYFYFRYLFDA
jgi:hypothetical protein